ncbi:MAG: hypothetical protein A2X13_01015 [Bacteroidetes bacterium GWC2_33_15]|nr:MAG: hypothetical protein A2X10_00110 [Bacteroidetes bacterium GWA2_33_15]OFX49942.1 MAG: hypothetical protein A2X13_01015 [Bacteroidetes bacterium GWC2_33_15]OFX64209.1 MAG: hypothetical protein A2X15_15150 [Bacteroidetes bacterium GWB2_32_14]OFX69622.1 MAG: hypothetical protein A2X14_15445 [Bacteroidetes bacterium GWD2_33_33]HAN19505.1 hypothetical protein [Bacteroidales bacterium]
MPGDKVSYNESLPKHQEQFRILNQSLSDLINLSGIENVYEYLTNVLSGYFKNTAVLLITIDTQLNEIELKQVKGIGSTLVEKIIKILGINPVGKHYRLHKNHINYFKQGEVIEISEGLKEFVSDGFPTFAVNSTQKLLKINKVYTIGINKDEQLFAAIHFFALNKTEISDFEFIESLVKQTGIVIQRILLRNELSKSEEKYRLLAENINDVILSCDIHFKLTYVSNSVETILGYTPEEFLAFKLEDIVDNQSLKILNSAISDRIAKTKNHVIDTHIKLWEIKVKHKDGQYLWFEISTNPLYNKQNEYIGIVSVCRNITDRKKTQEELNESQARYKILTDLTVEGIIIHENGIIVDVNPSALKVTGYTRDQIIGKNILNFIHPDSVESVKSKISNKFSGIYEISILCADNSSLVVEIEARNVFIESKEYRVVAFRNISERKITEKEILTLSTAVKQSPASIVITDLKGNIEYVNPQFTKITGYSYDEATGKNPRILKSGYTSPEEYEELWKIITTGGMWKGEFHNKRKDGTLYWELATVSPIIDEKGKIIQYIAVKEDITARKEAEDALKFSEKELKRANAAKDLFFSIIAHDLKGPVGNFVQFLELLTEKSSDYSESEKDDIIKTLFELSIKTNNLLDDLLLWSRIQMNKIDLTPGVHNLSQMLNSSIQIVSENAKKKNIEIINTIDENLFFYANDTSVKTIFRNLLSNAIKFSHRSSQVLINAKLNSLQKGFIEVAITDNGVGIPKEDIDKLFKIETNISTYGTEKEKGTGLGLILCKELVEKNGGKIRVESTIGKGSVFYFLLPANQQIS